MGLNIKNYDTCKRVAELARLTGESMTKAVDEAVRQRIESLGKHQRKGDLASELAAIGKDCAARLKKPFRNVEHGDLLYGKDGLPK